MKKAILISIKPQWIARILNGEKTIEVRKTAPKCGLPVDVYVYCTEPNAKETLSLFTKEAREHYGKVVEFIERKRVDNPNMRWSICNGKVVAKFTLRKVTQYITGNNASKDSGYMFGDAEREGVYKKACLSESEIDRYCPDESFYAWHISDLEIFDKPKELSEFYLKKAPQSWCYVEEKE